MDNAHETTTEIAIAGGGFTGTNIAAGLIRACIERRREGHDPAPLSLRLYDSSGIFGPGLPYADESGIFLLNQPASAMSPFPDDPNHFTHWLTERRKDTENPREVFASREEYGTYLKSVFDRASSWIHEFGLPVTLGTVHATISDATPGDGHRIVLHGTNRNAHACDIAVLADGHVKNDLLSGFRGDPGYFESPYDVRAMQEQLTKSTGDVAIAGTGQSMIDALAALDHIGFRGTIHAFSPDLVLPWPYDPELYGRDVSPWKPVFLTPDIVRKREMGLKELLQMEFRHAAQNGYGIGHVVSNKQLVDDLRESAPPRELDDLRRLVRAVYANPTPPQRHAMMQEHLRTGRLVLHTGKLSEDNVQKQEDGYVISCPEELRVTALFNAACYSREPSTLYRRAENIDGVYAAGPSVHPEKWGVETFRKHNAELVKTIINQL